MATITEHEEQQVEKANSSGLTPVVFIHGLWLLPSSWDRWAVVFEEAGFTTLTPGWPDDPETVEDAKAHPEVFAHKTVKQVADHFADLISKLTKKPAVIGHSFGGLVTQIIAGRGWPRCPWLSIPHRSGVCCRFRYLRSSRRRRSLVTRLTVTGLCRSPTSSSVSPSPRGQRG